MSVLKVIIISFCFFLNISKYSYSDNGLCVSECALQNGNAIFIGIGGEYNKANLNKVDFSGAGWLGEIGLDVGISSAIGIRATGDYGNKYLIGLGSNTTRQETSNIAHYSGKLGLNIFKLTLGMGMQYDKIEITSIGQNQAAKNYYYSGRTPFSFLAFSQHLTNNIGLMLEGQRHFEELNSLTKQIYLFQVKFILTEMLNFNFGKTSSRRGNIGSR